MLKNGEFVKPVDIAAWILNCVDRESGEAVTHLKLQKLVYYMQAWFLANFDRPLFEEDLQAWSHGPVSPSLFKKYTGNKWDALPKPKQKASIPSEVIPFLQAVNDEYSQYGAKKLEEITHSEEPWQKTRGNLRLEERCKDPIDKLLMRNYYAKRIGKEAIQKLQY